MTTDYNVVSWNRKKDIGKSKGNLNKAWFLVNDDILVSVH